MRDIYLCIAGKQEGPYAEDQLRQSLAEGLIPADLPAWYDGLPDWVPVESLINFSSAQQPESLTSSLHQGHGATTASVPKKQDLELGELGSSSKSLPTSRSPFSSFKYLGVGLAALLVLGLAIGLGIGMSTSHRGNAIGQTSSSSSVSSIPNQNDDSEINR